MRAALLALLVLAGCAGGREGGPYAPGPAGPDPDPLATGHRLMEAGEYELALDAFMGAALEDGLTADTLAAMGSANLGLGRLGQAEALLRAAVEEDAGFPAAWNNLGVLLMERERYGEASEAFRRAYAADSGNSDTIRDNLRLALGRLADPGYADGNAAPGTQPEAQLVGTGAGAPRPPEPL
jgi:Flp pilus assembly protein TadD